MISDDGQALLSGYGVSALVNSSFGRSMSSEAGKIDQPLRWMAPEIFDGSLPSPEADVWAFGMTALVCYHRSALMELNGICPGVVHT